MLGSHWWIAPLTTFLIPIVSAKTFWLDMSQVEADFYTLLLWEAALFMCIGHYL